jgi:4-hydroxy-3-methylbut-2-enyl diphosphate reductase
MTRPLFIFLARPRGFCAGVERAIEIVEKALALYGAPIYVRHEIVHNKWVVEDLRAKGVVFVDAVSEVPDGAITIFSAHGIAEAVEQEARLRGLPVIDATCPLVTKVHREAQRYEKEEREIVLIGHEGHPEVEGTMGRVNTKVHLAGSVQDAERLQVARPEKLAYVTQTTLSVDDTRDIINVLKRRFPSILGPELRDICYATQNRQNAVRELATKVELLLVIGSVNSSNSNRLRDLGQENEVPSYLIDDEQAIDPSWLEAIDRIGITAGASAPEHLVEKVIRHLSKLRPATVTVLEGVHENTRFKLPSEVLDKPFERMAKRNF